MSYFYLQDQYQISTERTYSWLDLGGGVSKEFNYLWSTFLGVSAQITAQWDILAYVSRQFTYMWAIGQYIAREFEYLYRIAMDFSCKMKYSFTMTKITTRFFRNNRHD